MRSTKKEPPLIMVPVKSTPPNPINRNFPTTPQRNNKNNVALSKNYKSFLLDPIYVKMKNANKNYL